MAAPPVVVLLVALLVAAGPVNAFRALHQVDIAAAPAGFVPAAVGSDPPGARASDIGAEGEPPVNQAREGHRGTAVDTLTAQAATTGPTQDIAANLQTAEVASGGTELPAAASVVAAAACPSIPSGYVFWPYYDSSGYDLAAYGGATLSTLVARCNENAACKGFNTNGYLKTYVKPLDQWYTWTSDPCRGLYIRSPTSFKVNGYTLTANEAANFRWVATWTVPNFGMSRYQAVRDYVGKGLWWALKEGNLGMSNPWNLNLCNTVSGDATIGPLATCGAGRPWQVGIASVQVPNYALTNVQSRARSAYPGLSIPSILGRSAQQAGYSTGTSTYNSITQATGTLQKAWLLKAHLVGFYFVATEASNECLIQTPVYWCYGTSWGATAKYAPTAGSISKAVGDTKVLLQSLVNGP